MIKIEYIKKIVYYFILILIIFIYTNPLKIGQKKEEPPVIIVPSLDLENNENDQYEKYSIIEQLRQYYNNDDVIAYLYIADTDINDAVFKTTDNEFYLNHDGFKKENIFGSIFMDYRIDPFDSKKILIFGHNSNDLDSVKFDTLEKYYEEDFYKEHQYIMLALENTIKTYKIFAVTIENSDYSYMNLNFNNNDEWYYHMLSMKSRSLYKINENINSDDNIIILQTCSFINGYYGNSDYLIILGKEIKTN